VDRAVRIIRGVMAGEG